MFGPGVWSVLLVALAAGVMLRWTVLGRYCFAIGSSEATARLCGIHVSRTKLLLYVLAGLITGWAGVLQTARGRTGSFNVQAGLELEVIAAAVMGGASLSGGEGSVVVTLLGVLAGGAAERLRDATAGERSAVYSSRLDYRECRRLEQLAPAATALGGVTVHNGQNRRG